MTHREPQTTPQPAPGQDETAELAGSTLVEDVSIDGMCGVY